MHNINMKGQFAMKKLYIALIFGCPTSGNFAMEKEKAPIKNLTFEAIAKKEGKDLAVILALTMRKLDDNSNPNEQYIELNFDKYNALKAINDKLSKSARTYFIGVVEPLTIQDFALCTREQIDTFEKQITERLHFLQQKTDKEKAKAIVESLGNTAYARNIVQMTNELSRLADNEKAKRSVLSSLAKRGYWFY